MGLSRKFQFSLYRILSRGGCPDYRYIDSRTTHALRMRDRIPQIDLIAHTIAVIPEIHSQVLWRFRLCRLHR